MYLAPFYAVVMEPQPVLWYCQIILINAQTSYATITTRRCNHGVINKVITTIVIRPLNDTTSRAQPVVADLRPLCLGYVGIGMS